nr:immunoglobulin heavy chain junction region [Mus musculus]MBK4185148.1 immunoglobulin heavy chain junction region [Mus musculus]
CARQLRNYFDYW